MNSLFKELKRRNIFRVAVAYLVIGWLLLQFADTLAPVFNLPDSASKLIFFILIIGFIPTLLFSWAFELTPEGIKREKHIKRDDSITSHTAKKLDMITLVALFGVVAFTLFDKFVPSQVQELKPETTVSEQVNTPQSIKDESTTSAQEVAIRSIANSKSIAVLPFANRSERDEDVFFVDGIHDDLLTNLARIGSLKVISRTSVARYKDSGKSIPEIAQELGVATVMEGAVQRSGDKVRINVQLIDAQTDEHLWAEIFDRELTTTNLFAIQSEISQKIAQALKATLSPEEQKRISEIPTQNLAAYNAYLQGRQKILKRSSESLKEGLVFFERANQLDPDFALAYVAQADVKILLNEYSDLSFKEMIEQGEPLIEKALTLTPDLAEAHTSKANYLLAKGKVKKAEEIFKYSLTLNPNYATTYHWYGLLLRRNGRNQEAVAMHRKAAELDPLSPVIQANVGFSLGASGLDQEALAQFYKVIELDPEYPGAIGAIAAANSAQGRLVESIIWQRKRMKLDPDNLVQRVYLFFMYLDIGEIELARSELEILESNDSSHSVSQVPRRIINMLEGDYIKALQSIEQSVQLEPNNPNIKNGYAYYNALNGNYHKAIDAWYELFPGEGERTFKLIPSRLGSAVELAYALQQLGQQEKANKLIEEALEMSEGMSFLGANSLDFDRAALFAIQGKNQLSAQAFSKAVDAGVRVGWWGIEHRPYFDKLRENVVFQKAYARLKEDIEKQKLRLREITLLKDDA